MTKTEFLDFLDGKRPDLVPVTFYHHFYDKKTMERFATEPALIQEFFEHNRRWRDETAPDFVKVMTDGFRKPNIDIGGGTPAEIAAVKILDLPFFIEKSIELVTGVREVYGADKALFYTIFSPFNVLMDALKPIYPDDTYGKITELFRTSHAEMEEGLGNITAALCEVVKATVAPGRADGIYLASRMCKQPRDIFEKYIAPQEIKVLDTAESISKYNILHICHFDGKQPDISVYKAYPSKVIHYAHVAEELPFPAAKEVLGDRVYMGGFGMKASDVLFTGPKEAVEAETQRLLDEMKGMSFIISSECSVSQKIDPAHLKWVVDYVKAHT